MIFNKGWDIDIQNQEPAGVIIFLIRTSATYLLNSWNPLIYLFIFFFAFHFKSFQYSNIQISLKGEYMW